MSTRGSKSQLSVATSGHPSLPTKPKEFYFSLTERVDKAATASTKALSTLLPPAKQDCLEHLWISRTPTCERKLWALATCPPASPKPAAAGTEKSPALRAALLPSPVPQTRKKKRKESGLRAFLSAGGAHHSPGVEQRTPLFHAVFFRACTVPFERCFPALPKDGAMAPLHLLWWSSG